jgi:hypothetical protein
MHLTVKSPFTIGGKEYARGDKIDDQHLIEDVLGGENAHHVIKTADLADGMNGTSYH